LTLRLFEDLLSGKEYIVHFTVVNGMVPWEGADLVIDVSFSHVCMRVCVCVYTLLNGMVPREGSDLVIDVSCLHACVFVYVCMYILPF
jgi:hypothetical protein